MDIWYQGSELTRLYCYFDSLGIDMDIDKLRSIADKREMLFDELKAHFQHRKVQRSEFSQPDTAVDSDNSSRVSELVYKKILARDVKDVEKNCYRKIMQNEHDRITSFLKYDLASPFIQTLPAGFRNPCELAKAGFYYVYTEEKARCYACGGELEANSCKSFNSIKAFHINVYPKCLLSNSRLLSRQPVDPDGNSVVIDSMPPLEGAHLYCSPPNADELAQQKKKEDRLMEKAEIKFRRMTVADQNNEREKLTDVKIERQGFLSTCAAIAQATGISRYLPNGWGGAGTSL